MDRRQFLRNTSLLLGTSAVGAFAGSASNKPYFGGWINDPRETVRFITGRDRPYASSYSKPIDGTGKGRVVRLWKLYERVTGKPFAPHFQDIGDCVAQAGALGVEVKQAVQVASGEKNSEWTKKISTEALYIASRVEVGKVALGWADGSTGAWAAEALEKFGTLFRQNYGDGFDVTKYNPKLARSLSGSRTGGIPERLIAEMAKHKVTKAVLVDGGWDQATDFVANGYPILLCSGVGYNNEADQYGFLSDEAEWNHSMLLWGIDTMTRKREGGCIANSWGPNWMTGPQHKYGTPAGAFWARKAAIQRMLDENDCYAIIEYDGPKRRNLDYRF